MDKKSVATIFLGIYILIFFTDFYYFDDPDSYYYNSIAKHIEKSDGTILGNILYYHGWYEGRVFLFSLTLVCALILYLFLNRIDDKFAIASSVFFLCTPLLLFHNSWLARMDKNIIEIFLFLIFIFIQYLYKSDLRSMITYFSVTIAVFLIIARGLWQGSIVFVMMSFMYVAIYTFLIEKKKMLFWFMVIPLALISLIIIFVYYPVNMFHVAEGQPDITHYLYPEIMIFFLMFYYGMKKQYKEYPKIFVINCVVGLLFMLLPRMLLLTVPMIAIMITINKELLNKNNVTIFGMMLIAFTLASCFYFVQDNHTDIKSVPDPCVGLTNCVIVSDWSYGHIYRNIWNESVMFTGHPSKLEDILDYMYYKNKSCDPDKTCVFVWHPRDYDILKSYAEKSDRPLADQIKNKNIVISIGNQSNVVRQ